MGQSIVVNEKPSTTPGIVRFETNRALTGMGHERYLAGEEVWGERPPDELARRLLAQPAVAGVHVNANVITVDLNKGFDSDGLLEIIENLYRFYPDGEPAAGAAAPVDGEAAAAEGDGPAPTDEAAAEAEAPAAAEAPPADAPAPAEA